MVWRGGLRLCLKRGGGVWETWAWEAGLGGKPWGEEGGHRAVVWMSSLASWWRRLWMRYMQQWSQTESKRQQEQLSLRSRCWTYVITYSLAKTLTELATFQNYWQYFFWISLGVQRQHVSHVWGLHELHRESQDITMECAHTFSLELLVYFRKLSRHIQYGCTLTLSLEFPIYLLEPVKHT